MSTTCTHCESTLVKSDFVAALTELTSIKGMSLSQATDEVIDNGAQCISCSLPHRTTITKNIFESSAV